MTEPRAKGERAVPAPQCRISRRCGSIGYWLTALVDRNAQSKSIDVVLICHIPYQRRAMLRHRSQTRNWEETGAYALRTNRRIHSNIDQATGSAAHKRNKRSRRT